MNRFAFCFWPYSCSTLRGMRRGLLHGKTKASCCYSQPVRRRHLTFAAACRFGMQKGWICTCGTLQYTSRRWQENRCCTHQKVFTRCARSTRLVRGNSNHIGFTYIRGTCRESYDCKHTTTNCYFGAMVAIWLWLPATLR